MCVRFVDVFSIRGLEGSGKEYAAQTVEGRSHGTNHHYIPERFYGRSANRPGTERVRILKTCPLGWVERTTGRFCYECHELLLHNPVLLEEDIKNLAELVRLRGLSEVEKPDNHQLIAGRIELFHEVIRTGLAQLLDAEREGEEGCS